MAGCNSIKVFKLRRLFSFGFKNGGEVHDFKSMRLAPFHRMDLDCE